MAAKRFFDITVASLLIALLAPVMLVTGIAIAVSMRRPLIYAQRRPGLHERLFTMYKFRTMTDDRDEHGELLPSETRMTRLGRILRATSLDELPQLFNVIKGELSMVGPRPLLAEYIEHYSLEQRRRHTVKPGVTGYAQVNGRNRITWDERLKMDLWYIDHWSLWLDFKIACATAWKVIKQEGACPSGSETMPRFAGQWRRQNDDQEAMQE